LLRRRDGSIVQAQATVGDAIAVPPARDQTLPRVIRGPEGNRIELTAAATTFDGADRPGVYHLQADGSDTALAVNLSSDESRTAPFPAEDLEKWGARIGGGPASDEQIAPPRPLQIAELEGKQKLWRWLIVIVLGILVAETALAGRLAHRASASQVTA
jgi:hypothetical protein